LIFTGKIRALYLFTLTTRRKIKLREREILEINNKIRTRVGRLVERGQHRGQIVTPLG
jgi:hypothetical protein